jgi:phthiocerol/phenolphthiocerol synthesis type-I polyketide synthase D
LELGAEAAEELVGQYSDITVAVYAAPQQTVVAGPPEQVDAVIAAVDAQGKLARRIEVDVASHHPTVDPILAELRTALADLAPVAPTIPLISTVGHTGDDGVPGFDADYWVDNLRNPVRFHQAVSTAAEKHATFVEMSPHPLLTYGINDTLAAASSASSAECVTVTSACKRVDDETAFLHTQLAALGVTAPDAGRFADIPLSPWRHCSHWLPSSSPVQRLPDVHPLLGVHVELLSGRDHVWQAHIGAEMLPWLAGHTVAGQAVMPAAGFAEMTLAAGCQALGLPAESVRISELGIEGTLALDHHTQVTTQLSRGDDGARVEIHARSAGSAWSRYAVAHAAPDDAATAAAAPVGASEADILVPDDVTDHPCYRIHPVLLDAALQRLAAVLGAESATAYQPVSVATLRVFGPVGRRATCHTEVVEQDDAGYLGRIVLTDDTGIPAAELTGIQLRPIDAGALQLPLQQKIFDTEWVASPETGRPVETPATSAAAAGTWLLLTDPDTEIDPETTSLAAEFTARFGSPGRRVIPGGFSDESALRQALTEAVADETLPPAGVIVLVGKRAFDGSDPDGELQRARDLILTISATARAVVDGWPGKSPRLWLVTRNGLAVRGGDTGDHGDPAIGALKGLIRNWRFPGEAARVLADEPDLDATLVDVGGADDAVAALMTELESPNGDDVVAWREQRRYTERLSRATLAAADREAIVRVDGAYIVTGGLGGLGMVVARWLVARGAGRVVLTGRSQPSERQHQVLAELAESTDVVFVPGDIATPGAAEQLVAAAEQTGRRLRGVVHAAGVTGDGLVVALTREGLESVWAAKVAGALRLHAATTDHELDWWVGFSSMATLLGLPGQAAYTTANAWLDALMAWRHASGMPATAINWGQWSDVGMSHKLTYSVLDPITPSEGTEALEALVGGDLTRVGVGRLRLDRAAAIGAEFREVGYFDNVVSEFGTASQAARTDDRSGRTDQDPSATSVPDWPQLSAEDRLRELVVRLQAILARELRTSPSAVNVDQPFPELGLDSMMAMTVLKETQQLVGIDLSASMFWNHPTISALSAHLVQLLATQHAPQDEADARAAASVLADSTGGVLDELFDSVDSAIAGTESGIF